MRTARSTNKPIPYLLQSNFYNNGQKFSSNLARVFLPSKAFTKITTFLCWHYQKAKYACILILLINIIISLHKLTIKNPEEVFWTFCSCFFLYFGKLLKSALQQSSLQRTRDSNSCFVTWNGKNHCSLYKLLSVLRHYFTVLLICSVQSKLLLVSIPSNLKLNNLSIGFLLKITWIDIWSKSCTLPNYLVPTITNLVFHCLKVH